MGNKKLDEELDENEELKENEEPDDSDESNEEVDESQDDTESSDEEEDSEDSKEDGNEDSGGEGEDKGKKSIFSKKKEKKDKKTQQIEELTDRLKRTMAEFDNFRKRTEKEKSGMYESGARGVIEKLLPVVDNFERAFKDITDEQKQDPFVDGMDKVLKQILTIFDELGVKAIETEGQQFNPDFHNAVMHIEDEELEENVVAEEFQKGYTYKDTVIRHSMVKVAN